MFCELMIEGQKEEGQHRNAYQELRGPLKRRDECRSEIKSYGYELG